METEVEYDSDIKFPYHLNPNIIKMALYIHNAESEQETIQRTEFGLKKFGDKFMAHCMAMLMLPYLMEQGMKSDDYKNFMERKHKKEYHTWQQELQQRKATMSKNINMETEVEYDSDIKFPYHLNPNIIKMALYIHNAESEQETIQRTEFGLKKFGDKFMAHCMAMLMLPYLMEQGMKSDDYKNFMERKHKKFN